jgi:hypothetical protein
MLDGGGDLGYPRVNMANQKNARRERLLGLLLSGAGRV